MREVARWCRLFLPRSGGFGCWLLARGGPYGQWRGRFLILFGIFQMWRAEAQPPLHAAGKAVQHWNDHQREQR